MQTPQSIPVPVELLQAVVDYLAKRPFDEVHQLIPALMQCARPAPQSRPEAEAAADCASEGMP